jgi:hypothetical protein
MVPNAQLAASSTALRHKCRWLIHAAAAAAADKADDDDAEDVM